MRTMTDQPYQLPDIEPVREFVAEFGLDNTRAIFSAADAHWSAQYPTEGYTPNEGSDPLAWALAQAIGNSCLTVTQKEHGIDVNVDAVKRYVREHRLLDNYDGDFPLLGYVLGAYTTEWCTDAAADFTGQPYVCQLDVEILATVQSRATGTAPLSTQN